MVKKIYAACLSAVEGCAGLRRAKELDVLLRFHRVLHLKNPETLPEKICWLSLYGDWQLMARCADKWEVRDYVREKGLERLLVPVYGPAVARAEEIPFQLYPEQFVLKATHGCKMNDICTDRSKLDADGCRRKAAGWLATKYGTYSVEPHYRELQPRVYCEAYLGPAETLIDYKIFCYNGEPQYIMVCSQRETMGEKQVSRVALQLYDLEWKPLPWVTGWKEHYAGRKEIPRPERLEEMLEAARSLSQDFDFVRVDLYEVNHRVYFGELTFTPANGVLPSFDRDFLREEGAKLKITAAK